LEQVETEVAEGVVEHEPDRAAHHARTARLGGQPVTELALAMGDVGDADHADQARDAVVRDPDRPRGRAALPAVADDVLDEPDRVLAAVRARDRGPPLNVRVL